jgi:predicted anti-sigma-YlaC factor YlaD
MHDHEPCREIIEGLSDFIDGTAEEALCKEIESHLAACPDCKIMIDTLRKTISLYREREAETTLPPHVHQQLIRTLHLEDLLPGNSGKQGSDEGNTSS